MFGAENDPSNTSNNQHFLSETTSYHSFFVYFVPMFFMNIWLIAVLILNSSLSKSINHQQKIVHYSFTFG